jgi:hypothetical protein
MKILRVLRVDVVRQSDSPLTLLVSAEGLAATAGWSNARLDDSLDPNPKDAVLELSFDADRPQGLVPQVLTPIVATVVLDPKHGADAVIVSARTNSITVHASEFLAPAGPGSSTGFRQPFTTWMFGEEHPTTGPRLEEQPTTLALGEEGPTTWRFGEEGPTLRFGEGPTTHAFGEEPLTDPRVDDPFGGGFGGGPFGSY